MVCGGVGKAMEKSSRRMFLRNTAITAGSLVFAPVFCRASAASYSANERINIGFIGTGKRGTNLLRTFVRQAGVRAVAVCDVDSNKMHRAREVAEEYYSSVSNERCAVYNDYRAVLVRRDVDAVVIGTPDHWHAIPAITACEVGKDVYCEKPLSLTVAEGRAMVRAARKYKRVFQTGSQQRSSFEFRHACELVRSGYIGRLVKVQANIAAGGWPVCSRECELGGEPVPEDLDWDMWLGPAPRRPYHSEIAPDISFDGFPHWRYFRDYSGGLMTDWGAHHFDIAQWALGMDESGPVEVIPPKEGTDGTLVYVYSNGVELRRENFGGGLGILFTGTEGSIEVYRGWIQTKPASLVRKVITPSDIQLHRSDNHYADWLKAIRERTRPVADVEAGHRSATVCHIGNIATRLGRGLRWDAAAEVFVRDEEANKMLWRSMRSPWRL
jgi:predicted dehydrogenase